jgi:hypothetical protein
MTPQQLADSWQIEVETLSVAPKKNTRREVLPFRKIGSLLRYDFDEVRQWTTRLTE